MTKYGKHESDYDQWNKWVGLWSIKWIRWTMINKMDEMDYGRWNEWDGLWSVKWMRWTMINKINEVDYDQ